MVDNYFQKAFSRVMKENNMRMNKEHSEVFFNLKLKDIKILPGLYLPQNCLLDEFFSVRNGYFNLIRKEYNEIVKKYFLYLLEINGIRLQLKKHINENKLFLIEDISTTHGLIDRINASQELKIKIFMVWRRIIDLKYNEITLEKIYEINKNQ